jgi:hypothetical protein
VYHTVTSGAGATSCGCDPRGTSYSWIVGAEGAIEVGISVEVGSTVGVGETIEGAVAVGLMISIAGVFGTAIVGPGAGGATQPPINPAMKIDTSEIFMSSSLVIEPQQSLIRIILYGGNFADP